MENNRTLYRQVMDLILTARPGQPIYPVAIKATLKLKTTKHITKILNRVAKNPNNRYGLRKYKAGVYYSIHNKGEKYEGLDGTERRFDYKEYLRTSMLFDLKTGKRIGFECGDSYYNHIGLTTQVPNVKTIITNKPINENIIKDNTLALRSLVRVTGNNFRVLQILYVLEHLREVMDINEWWESVILRLINNLSEGHREQVIKSIESKGDILHANLLELLRR